MRKSIYAVIFCLTIALAACGPPRIIKILRANPDMTYDSAITYFGPPTQCSTGDKVIVCAWRESSNSTIFSPTALGVIATPIQSGYELRIIFDRQTRSGIRWYYRRW